MVAPNSSCWLFKGIKHAAIPFRFNSFYPGVALSKGTASTVFAVHGSFTHFNLFFLASLREKTTCKFHLLIALVLTAGLRAVQFGGWGRCVHRPLLGEIAVGRVLCN